MIIPVYAGIVFSSFSCLMATIFATVSYVGIGLAQESGWLAMPRPAPPGAWSVATFNLLMLNVIGGGMSNGNIHSHMDVPIALVGGAGGLRGNRHVAMPMGTPLSNLHVSLVNKAGIPIESFGDSTGMVDLNAVPASQRPTPKT